MSMKSKFRAVPSPLALNDDFIFVALLVVCCIAFLL